MRIPRSKRWIPEIIINTSKRRWTVCGESEDANEFAKVIGVRSLSESGQRTDYFGETCSTGSMDPARWRKHVIYARRGKRISVNILGRIYKRKSWPEELRLREAGAGDIIRTLAYVFCHLLCRFGAERFAALTR